MQGQLKGRGCVCVEDACEDSLSFIVAIAEHKEKVSFKDKPLTWVQTIVSCRKVTFSKINRNLVFLSDRVWDSQFSRVQSIAWLYWGFKFSPVYINCFWVKESGWGWMRIEAWESLNFPCCLQGETSMLRKPMLAVCWLHALLLPGLCSIWRHVVYTVHRLHLCYSRSGHWLSEIMMTDDIWWLSDVWVKWFALSLNKSLTAGSLGEQGSERWAVVCGTAQPAVCEVFGWGFAWGKPVPFLPHWCREALGYIRLYFSYF